MNENHQTRPPAKKKNLLYLQMEKTTVQEFGLLLQGLSYNSFA